MMKQAHGGWGNNLLTLAAIRQTDDLIKKLVKELKNLERETIVVFHSDNGATTDGCNYPYKGWKTMLTEGGTLSPAFLYKTHSVQQVKRTNEMIHIIDWFPTLLQLAELPIPTGLRFVKSEIKSPVLTLKFSSLDGVNQKHLFEEDEAVSGRDRFVYSVIDKIPYRKYYSDTTWQQGYAVRVGRWKFYNYRHTVGIRQCNAGFQNDQLFNDLKDAYPTTAEYESYLQLAKKATEWNMKKTFPRSYNKDLFDEFHSSGSYHWQLYDLKLDPFEANDLFEVDRIFQLKKVEPALSGEVKESYIKHGYNLTAAVEEIFVSYMDQEMSKGYRGPAYPHKMWSTIFQKFSEGNDGPWFLSQIGYVRPNTKVYSKDYCEDLSLLRTRIEDIKSSRNSSAYHQRKNELFNEMDIRHIQKYL